LSGTWADVAATNRGLILEEFDFVRRGGRLPPGLTTYNHRFYPIADDFRDGALTQYKTVDFANFFQSSERISTWERGIRDSIDKLARSKADGIQERVVDGVVVRAINPADIFETRIEIIVPPRFAVDSGIAAQQQAALQRVLEYANENLDQAVVRWAN